MYKLLRSLLFCLPAEQAHTLVLRTVGWLCRLPVLREILRCFFAGSDTGLAVRCFGLRFRNPVGLAAGMDKDGRYLWLWWVLGFGFVEVGTVTPELQTGNPRPRLFRLPKQQALINTMGFNNTGKAALQLRLQRRPPKLLLGINIGKQKDTPLEEAANDYLRCLKDLYSLGDYFVLNVSSPNTESLRELQSVNQLYKLLKLLVDFNEKQSRPKPLLLKISPDLSEKELQQLFLLCKKMRISGLIATNTTTQREGIPTDLHSLRGGLSGAPLRRRASEVLAYLAQQPEALPLIGVGGICSPEDALQRRSAGAKLVQLYTGLVYEGPSLPRRIKARLRVLKSSTE